MQKCVEGFILKPDPFFDIVKLSKRTASMCGSFHSETEIPRNIFNEAGRKLLRKMDRFTIIKIDSSVFSKLLSRVFMVEGGVLWERHRNLL